MTASRRWFGQISRNIFDHVGWIDVWRNCDVDDINRVGRDIKLAAIRP